MNLFDYIVNLSIFSVMISTPLIIRSFLHLKPLHQFRYWGGLYAGIVSAVLVTLSFPLNGYVYDIRYVPVLLSFAYFGPMAGIITGSFALLTRLAAGGNWGPVLIGWLAIMTFSSLVTHYYSRKTALLRSVYLFIAYAITYVIMVPILFGIVKDQPFFHFQYLVFVSLGMVTGVLFIESYETLYRIIKERKRMEGILEESEAKYRLIAENTSDLIMVINRDRTIEYYSPSHESVLGYNEEEVNKMKMKDFLHPDDVERFKTTIQDMFDTNQSHSIEIRLKNKQGEYLEFESRGMPAACNKGLVEHLVMISRDLSERKKAEHVLLQSEKLSIVGELAAGVAHEIRNPLTTIKGFVQLYQWENQSNAYNEVVLSELNRIESITSELLTLGKPQATQLTTLNLVELIKQTLEFLEPQANLYNIEFYESYETTSVFVKGEKNQLKQVVLNLIKNAMESMDQGGKIHVSVWQEGKQGCIAIQDEGCGIPEELLPRLGEPFYSLKEKGTGLGIMICHKIIQQHNGKISYTSKVDVGTTVEIRLPLDIHEKK